MHAHRVPRSRLPHCPGLPSLLLAAVIVPLLGCTARSASQAPLPRPQTAAEPQWQLDWARRAVFYEIFVRSFADSNGDGIGDLPGLTAKLDYLNDGDPGTTSDLGIDGIWLMPIFASPSYHGYDVTDYERIDPEYGTGDDFQRLLAEAHRRGIRVIVDLVINHTSSQHPWFGDSASSPTATKRNWYVWRADDPGWTQPWGGDNPTWHEKNGSYYYAILWGGMPDLNFRTPAVRSEVERLAQEWLARGVDGFRLDAARHIVADGPGQLQNDTPETHAFWKEFSQSVRASHPGALLVGEAWAPTATIATYYGSTATVRGGDELPMCFDFPLAGAIVNGVREGEAAPIEAALEATAKDFPSGVLDATFLTNHDMIRLATQLDNDQGALKSAAAVLLTLPGTPFLYYGEEVGLENGARQRDDRFKRTPMPWDDTSGGGFTAGTPWFPFAPGRDGANVAAELDDPSSLLSRYRTLIRLRKVTPVLAEGGLRPLSAAGPVLAFLRTGGADGALVVHNLGATVITAGPFSLAGTPGEALLTDPGVVLDFATPGAARVTLPAHASGIWHLGPAR
jgi:alpha-amylase